MRRRRTGVGKTAIVALLVAVVVVVAAVAFVSLSQRPIAYLPTSSSSTNASTTQQSTTPSGSGGSITVKSNTTGGLQLTATIRPVVDPQGGNITVMAQVYNTLSSEVVMNYTSMANPASGPCQQGFATGVRVYQGNFTLANLSQGTELKLYNPSLLWICPTLVSYQYSFSPNSDMATWQDVKGQVNETSILAGYWTGSGQNYTFQAFPVGNYTLVVFDAWGQTAIGHFYVDFRGATTSSTSVETSSTSTAPPTKGTYAVAFQQIGACSPTFWGVPWSVTIGNVTKVQPPDAKLPLDNYSLSGTSNSSLSEITFSLTNGTYAYRVSPSAGFFTPTSGTINVSDSNITVDITYTGTSCITTTQTASSGNKGG